MIYRLINGEVYNELIKYINALFEIYNNNYYFYDYYGPAIRLFVLFCFFFLLK